VSDAVASGNWLRVALWFVVGSPFLIADNLKVRNPR
jgi:hypothetical protein